MILNPYPPNPVTYNPEVHTMQESISYWVKPEIFAGQKQTLMQQLSLELRKIMRLKYNITEVKPVLNFSRKENKILITASLK